jgi:hypothetical protein
MDIMQLLAQLLIFSPHRGKISKWTENHLTCDAPSVLQERALWSDLNC